MTIDADDRLYIVDMTARIQVYDAAGNYLRGWQTPVHVNGRPTGISIGRDGRILVADTHYFRVLSYTPTGELIESRTIGGEHGHEPGQFGFVTDAVEDAAGNVYVSEYGEFDRIQKFSPSGKFLKQWGSHGSEPGQFVRPQSLEIDERGQIWVADACNHRIQVFNADGELVKIWGQPGAEIGQLYYPYSVVLDGRGHVYVCEYGNHRVQKFDLDGHSLGCWGAHGREAGQMHNPWAIVCDRKGKIHVLDSNNHRVQRITL